MPVRARILADSLNPDGQRLTTLQVEMPRFILAEFNTHRAFSRNSASSRAIPVIKQVEAIQSNPFIPKAFPVNKPGMSADEYITAESDPNLYTTYVGEWLWARDDAIDHVYDLAINDVSRGGDPRPKVHKQIATRLLEPFMWHTVIVSATDWDNFFQLRISPQAQPEMRDVAVAIKREMVISENEKLWTELDWGEWHLPMLSVEDTVDLPVEDQPKISAGRCARVSYLTHDGRRDSSEDLRLFGNLSGNGHLSPLEHPAYACSLDRDNLTEGSLSPYHDHGNFRGWHQLRKDYE